MKHFDITHWADFARGVAADADRAAMEAHLSSGCRRCRGTLAVVQRVVTTARTEALYEPPESVVRCAKAISALLRPQGSTVSRLILRLAYDSFRDPVPAGMRAEDRVSRHTLFEAGNFALDLRLEQEKGSPLTTLVGQLTNREEPDGSLDEAPVLLMTRKEIVAHAVYNRFGEFQMDYPPSRHLRLCISVNPPGRRLELSLNRLVAEMPAPTEVGLTRRRTPGHTRARAGRK
jgi:hypothetical protein